MGDYTKIKINDAKSIFKLYFEDEILSLRALSLGISNSNYELRTEKTRYLLKVSNDKMIDDVIEEMNVLKLLNECKYQYSLFPILTLDKRTVYQFKDYYGVLFPFIEGIPPGPSDDTCFEIGSALAKLHCIRGDFSNIRDSKDIAFPPEFIRDFVKNESCPEDFKDSFERLLDTSYFSHNFEKGIIHGDLYSDNTLFDNNHIKAVLDFEQSGIGDFIFDLGVSLSGCCLEKGRISKNLIDSYLSGYEKIRPLPDQEKNNLDQAIIWGLFSISLWRIKRFTLANLNPLLADSYKELLLRAEIFKEQIND